MSLSSCVCPESFCLVWSIQSIWSNMFRGSCKGVSGVSVWSFKEGLRMFQGSLKSVHRKFHGCFKEVKGVLRKFQECFKEVSGKFQGGLKWDFKGVQVRLKGISSSFKGVLSVFERSSKQISGKFRRYYKKDSMVFWQSFKGVFKELSKVLQECFNGVLSGYQIHSK